MRHSRVSTMLSPTFCIGWPTLDHLFLGRLPFDGSRRAAALGTWVRQRGEDPVTSRGTRVLRAVESEISVGVAALVRARDEADPVSERSARWREQRAVDVEP